MSIDQLTLDILEDLGGTILWHRQGDPSANPPSRTALRVLLYTLAVYPGLTCIPLPKQRDLKALRLTAPEWVDAWNELMDEDIIQTEPPARIFHNAGTGTFTLQPIDERAAA